MSERATIRQRDTSPGVISVTEIYALDEARKRLRWTESSLRAAKRKGLRLLACGKRRYVTGAEILRFLESRARVPVDVSRNTD